MKFLVCFILLMFISGSSLAMQAQEGTTKFGMQAVLTSTPGKAEELSQIMLRASEVVSSMKGCELYLVQQSLTDENQILITELWSSKEDHQNSLTNEKVRALIGEAKPILSAISGNPVKYLGGHGVK